MKSAPPKNSSILNFFKPKQDTASQQSQTQSQSQTLAGSPDGSSPQEGSTPQSAQSQPTPPDSGPGAIKRPEEQTNGSATRNGKFVVRSSDSEDSDDSLDELPVIRGNRPVTTTAKSTAVVPPISVLRTPPRTRKSAKFDPSPIPVRPRLKNDLASLAKQSQQEKKEEATSAALRALLDGDLEIGENNEELGAQGLLDSLDPEDGDDTERVLQAYKRQAPVEETRWFFFDTTALSKKSGRSDFPKKAISQCRWKSALTNPATFRQTVLSGFADEMLAMGEELPEELLLWMLDEVCFESSDAVRHSYCQIVSCHRSDTVSRLVDKALIQKLFRNLGGTEEAVKTDKGVNSIKTIAREHDARSWDQLISVVTLLGMVARSLSKESRNYCICLLARLCIDNVVMESLALFRVLHDAMKSLILSIPEAHWTSECNSISRTIFDFTESSIFRFQIIQCIPDQGIPRLHNLRRQLSLSFFFNDASLLSQPFSTSLSLPTITKYLSSSHFSINPSTDYPELSSLICLLDIAVADGQTTDNKVPANEDEFNSNVDGLTKSLDILGSGIRDASAAHASRTDAKSAIKVVTLRLGTMRTKRKPRITIWGEDTSLKDLRPENSDMMEKFFIRRDK